jgi:L-aspartate oxidase
LNPIPITLENRYLVRFNPKRIPHAFADVLIIGGGISGIRAALSIDPRLETIVITKDVLNVSNSAWAQGGIASVFDPTDTFENHTADTITAGKGLCDEVVVRHVVEAAPELINELVNYGAHFDQSGDHLALTQEGGHSHRRIVHALGDATGREVMRALIIQLREQEHIQIWEKTFTIDLLTSNGRCVGAIVWNPEHGRTFVWAKQTILATGGAGQLYRESTNPEIATADGHAIAFRAGAEVRDMELMQFHPTVLYIAGGSRHLISEAVRGEGAFLRNIRGERFMPGYHELAELAPRDEVSRAITDQMEKTQHPCVYLDLRHLDHDLIKNRFPNIAQMCAKFGLNIHTDLIPVRPGAHYMIGGVTTDLEGRTTLSGLWAAGEVTSTGLHGANRLASNSLLEGLYYGDLAGKGASDAAMNVPDVFTAWPLASDVKPVETSELEELNVVDLRNSLSSLMSRRAGILRKADGLIQGLEQVQFWERYVSTRTFSNVSGWELQNMLLVARLMLKAALTREESRGVHFREDFPETDPQWAKHIPLIANNTQ